MSGAHVKSHPMWYEPEEKRSLMERALDLIAEGSTLSNAAASVGVAKSTLSTWMREDEWAERSARATELLTHALADQCLAIADSQEGDVIVDGEGNERPNHDFINRAKLRIDTRMRLIGKWNRKDYGDRTEVSGPGGGPIQSEVTTSARDILAGKLAGLVAGRAAPGDTGEPE